MALGIFVVRCDGMASETVRHIVRRHIGHMPGFSRQRKNMTYNFQGLFLFRVPYV